MSPACGPVCPGISRAMLCILLLSGFCSCLHHYYLIDEPKTWQEAQKYCREKYKDLASVNNKEDMERLIAAAGSGYEGKVWIALYDKPWAWIWSLSGPNIYGEGKNANFRRWNTGQPDDVIGNGQLCVAFLKGFWSDYACDRPRTFVCYNNTLDSAPTSKRHFFINNQKTWYEARSYCRQHYTDLASVRNKIENTMIQEVIPNNQKVTIGLHRYAWVWWSDGSGTSFKNWADGHPRSVTESCAASVFNATHLGKWEENHCGKKLHFMCHNNKMRLFNVKLTVLKSKIDLNDSSVMEAILNQVEKKINEKGITRDFKIAWIKKPDKNIFHKEEENTDVAK